VEENVAELDDEEGGGINDTVDDGVACSDVTGKKDESCEWENENCTHQ